MADVDKLLARAAEIGHAVEVTVRAKRHKNAFDAVCECGWSASTGVRMDAAKAAVFHAGKEVGQVDGFDGFKLLRDDFRVSPRNVAAR